MLMMGLLKRLLRFGSGAAYRYRGSAERYRSNLANVGVGQVKPLDSAARFLEWVLD